MTYRHLIKNDLNCIFNRDQIINRCRKNMLKKIDFIDIIYIINNENKIENTNNLVNVFSLHEISILKFENTTKKFRDFNVVLKIPSISWFNENKMCLENNLKLI